MIDIEKGVKEYLQKIGSVDRKDIIEHDFREGVNWALEQLKAIPLELRVIQKTAGALLPCPFCGSKAKIVITSQVKCSNIGCIASSYCMHDTLWNRRVNSRFSV